MPGPFDPNDDAAYAAWRERKLADHPRRLEELIVEVVDPRRPHRRGAGCAWRAGLRGATWRSIAGRTGDDSPTRTSVMALGRAFGLSRLDHNPGADEDAVTSLQITTMPGTPATSLLTAIRLAHDRYLHARTGRFHGLLLHCVRPALAGAGRNRLLDHEIAYIRLRRTATRRTSRR